MRLRPDGRCPVSIADFITTQHLRRGPILHVCCCTECFCLLGHGEDGIVQHGMHGIGNVLQCNHHNCMQNWAVDLHCAMQCNITADIVLLPSFINHTAFTVLQCGISPFHSGAIITDASYSTSHFIDSTNLINPIILGLFLFSILSYAFTCLIIFVQTHIQQCTQIIYQCV